MKKLLILSIAFNIAIITFLVGKRYYYSHSFINTVYDYNSVRCGMFSALTIDTSDIVFVGNSLTEAFMVSEFFGPHCKNRGINGNRIADIINRISPIAERHPAKMFLEGGINDISNGASAEMIMSNYRALIEIIKDKSPGTKIFLQSVLPTGKEYKNKEKVIALNALLNIYCKENNLPFIDLYQRFERGGYIIDSLSYDGVHLNSKGYAIWQKAIQQYVN
jgi:lysophospholipase L1-like esterase